MRQRLTLAAALIAAAIICTLLFIIVLCALSVPAHALSGPGNPSLRRWCGINAQLLEHAPDIREQFPDAPVMVRVSCCESQGDTGAVNKRTGDYGLGQVNWRVWHRALRSAGIAQEPTDLLQPAAGIAAMRLVYDTQGLRAWKPSRRCWA